MNTATMQPGPWSRRRWWMLIALVFAVHLGLIFAIGDRKPIVPRQAVSAPMLWLAADGGELLALNDPTLFARPHRQGFAGAAWLQITNVPPGKFEWTEPPRWLALPEEQLGAVFARFMETNGFVSFQLALKPAPELTVPELAPEPALGMKSELRIEGEIAQRQLLNAMDLPSLPGADILTNSVVQVLVDAAGDTVSVTLLPAGGGAKDADQQKADERALELAKAARFKPLARDDVGGAANPAAGLSWGKMIFRWHTVPLPMTTAPAETTP